MVLQSHQSGCVWKTPFRKSGTDVDKTVTEDPVNDVCALQRTDNVIKPVLQAKQTGIKPKAEELKGEGRGVHILL